MGRFLMANKRDRRQNRQMVGDGLQNVVANLGTGRDKAASTTYVTSFFSSHDLVDAYRSSWLAAAIVDYPAEDATRKWRLWQAESDVITKLENEEKRLQLRARVQQALKLSRVVGGAAIYINTKPQDPRLPLAHTEEIHSLVVLTKDQLTSGEVVRDIDSDYFGSPEYFTITAGNESNRVDIHASRFAMFTGEQSVDCGMTNSFWGDSVLQRAMDAVKNHDATFANVASLVFEAKVDVFKFEGFADLLSQAGGDNKLYSRLIAQAAMKGINGTVAIDKQDDYEQKSASFGGLDAVMSKMQEAAAGAGRIPSVRLFGLTSAGLSGSGDGDERIYYDRVEDLQSQDISPAIAKLDECIIFKCTGSTTGAYYNWAPLRQLTQNDKAELFLKYANGARAIAGATGGATQPLDAFSVALTNTLVEAGVITGLEEAIKKYGNLPEQGLGNDEVQ